VLGDQEQRLYRRTPWVRDEDGRLVDPERDRISWDEDGLNFLGTGWQLLEASLVGVPADAAAAVRAIGGAHGCPSR
jgi:hypothetical protein